MPPHDRASVMLRLWKTSYARPARVRGPVGVSVVAHAALIGAWVLATLPPPGMPPDGLANRVRYIPPPNPTPPPPAATGERVHYISLALGEGIGPGIATVDPSRPFTTAQGSSAGGEVTNDTIPPDTASVSNRGVSADSIYTVVDVDSAVVRLQTSAAPAYPLDLLQKRIEGMVTAQYVVDTTGFADTASFHLMNATDSGFVRAVRDALPYMRFIPAKIGAHHVRQLVQQSFAFRISPSLLASPARGKRP